MAEHVRKRWQLVLIVSPLQGHMTPILQLGTYLHSKGFSITIAHSKINPPNPSNHSDFMFFPMSDNLSRPGDFPSFVEFLQALGDNCKPHLQQHVIQMINTQKDTYVKESIIIIYDNLMSFARTVASELSLPSIIMHCSSAAFFPAYKIIPQLHLEGRFHVEAHFNNQPRRGSESIQNLFEDSLLQEIVPELHPFRYKDLPFANLPIQQALQSVSMITPNTAPSAFIYNTIEFLEPSALTEIHQQYQVPIFTVGPLHKIIPTPSTSFLEEDTSCIPWLNKQSPKSVIYVSLGSIATPDKLLLTQMACGLVNSNLPFLWVVRAGSVHGFKWIEFLPEGLVDETKKRGLIVEWAPQKEVLAHNSVGGFWSHCGRNSVLESVSEGVPMLCQPFSVDQLLNARYLSYEWKMGIEVVWKIGEIEGAIRRLMLGRESEELRQKAMEIREKIQVAIKHGGSSQSSLNDLVDFIIW
ncbi:UDP-glycosyltransferase 76H1 [Artemisia annua]|uniref:UDP-glycosyltransferase 76H1 n=1 Tax=Artemisia annua TaxID=35608 RepID=A0A2U1PCE1_ARTAN|nr:UDP-glycosyltransferase 76H1 [Artemisia annua]